MCIDHRLAPAFEEETRPRQTACSSLQGGVLFDLARSLIGRKLFSEEGGQRSQNGR